MPYNMISMTPYQKAMLKAQRDQRPSLGERFLTGAIFPAIGHGLGYAAQRGIAEAFAPEPAVDPLAGKALTVPDITPVQMGVPTLTPQQMSAPATAIPESGMRTAGMDIPQLSQPGPIGSPSLRPQLLSREGQLAQELRQQGVDPQGVDLATAMNILKRGGIVAPKTRAEEGAATGRTGMEITGREKAATTNYGREVEAATTADARKVSADVTAFARDLVKQGVIDEAQMARTLENVKAARQQAYVATKEQKEVSIDRAKGRVAAAYEQFNAGQLDEAALDSVIEREAASSGAKRTDLGQKLVKQDDGTTKWKVDPSAAKQFTATYAKEALARKKGEADLAKTEADTRKADADLIAARAKKVADEFDKHIKAGKRISSYLNNLRRDMLLSSSLDGKSIDKDVLEKNWSTVYKPRLDALYDKATTDEEKESVMEAAKDLQWTKKMGVKFPSQLERQLAGITGIR